MSRFFCKFRDEQAAVQWVEAKKKFNPKIEKIDGGWLVSWEPVKTLKKV